MSKVACIALIAAALPVARGQQLPPIRSIGPVERVSTEPLRTATTVVALSDGRVYVNDELGRRVVLFDSTLSHAQIVADSTAKTYGARPGTLIAFRGDSVLFVDPASQSMLVVGPSGKIDRVIAMPKPATGPQFQINALVGIPGFDTHGRLVSVMAAAAQQPPKVAPGQPVTFVAPDSALLVSFDLVSRVIDTVGSVRTSYPRMTIVRDANGNMTSITGTPVLLPVVDSWAIEHDGTVVAVRGRDFHVDRLGGDGRWHSGPKLPFPWVHLSDSAKIALIDSSMAAIKAQRAAEARHAPTPSGGGRGSGGAPPPTMIDGRPAPMDLPEEKPAFLPGPALADADGNLWIETTAVADSRPVYDIVNPSGALVDRIQLPPSSTIAGFGLGVVYLEAEDAGGIVHVERAAIKRK